MPRLAGDQQHHTRAERLRLDQAVVEPVMRRGEGMTVEVEREIRRERAAGELALPGGVETRAILPQRGRGTAGRRPGVEGRARFALCRRGRDSRGYPFTILRRVPEGARSPSCGGSPSPGRGGTLRNGLTVAATRAQAAASSAVSPRGGFIAI
jgi:hypothetical protein